MPGYALAVPVVPRSVSRPLWRALSAATEPASIRDLHIATAAHPNAIQLRLKRWERAGLVAATSEKPRRFIMADTVPTPPVMKADGTVHRRTTARQRLWTAMRILKCFDLPTLILSSDGVTRRSTEDYINVLCRAGYLKRISVGSGMTGDWATYRLLKRSGRTAPAVSHKRSADGLSRILIDRNDGTRHDISPGRVSLRATADRSGTTDPVVDGGVG